MRCAAWSASAICIATASAGTSSSGPRARRAARVSPIEILATSHQVRCFQTAFHPFARPLSDSTNLSLLYDEPILELLQTATSLV
jgi:hypothetical protein